MLKKTKGLTLIELVISLALIGLVMQVVYSLFFAGNNFFVINTNKGFTQQEVRLLGDIVNSELKYVTNMTTDPDNFDDLINYYSLEMTTDTGVPILLRKFYEYDGSGYVVSEKRFPGSSAPYKSFRITNEEGGIINVLIEHELKKGKLSTGYELPFNIHLLNNPGLATGIEIDLMEEGTVLYYTKAQDELSGKRIDIPDVPPGEEYEEGPEPTTSPEPTEIPEPSSSPDPTATPLPVDKQVTAGKILDINNKEPKKNKKHDDRYNINKANQGDGRNLIRIKLDGYDYEMHKNGKVIITITVNNTDQSSFILDEQSGIVSFYIKASGNGSGQTVDVKLEVKTLMDTGERTDEKAYGFITD